MLNSAPKTVKLSKSCPLAVLQVTVLASEPLTRVCCVVRSLQNSCVYLSFNSCFQEPKSFNVGLGGCCAHRQTLTRSSGTGTGTGHGASRPLAPAGCRVAVQETLLAALLQTCACSEWGTSSRSMVYIPQAGDLSVGGRPALTEFPRREGSQGTQRQRQPRVTAGSCLGPDLRVPVRPLPFTSNLTVGKSRVNFPSFSVLSCKMGEMSALQCHVAHERDRAAKALGLVPLQLSRGRHAAPPTCVSSLPAPAQPSRPRMSGDPLSSRKLPTRCAHGDVP